MIENQESTKRQYALRERAIALGWPTERIHVIDSDLGQSGAQAAGRDGFTELVNKVAKSLTKNVDHQEKLIMHSSGGVRPAAELLNSLDREESKNILTRMEERNPELTNAIRKKMFGFADLVRLEQKDLQRIMREVDTSDLVLALKTATPMLNDAICGAISKRAADTLKEELEMLGSVRLRDVEAAQDRIIQIVRRLEEQEEVSLEKGGTGVVN